MARSLERIAYCSHATLSLDSLLVIADILAVSRRNNNRDDLTGSLAYSEGRFFQVVEGQAVDVDRMMKRVTLDRRHSDILVVSRMPVEGRIFADWSMNAPSISPGMAPVLKRAIDDCQDAPTAAIELLRRITVSDGGHFR